MKSVSWVVPYAIALAGTITIALLLFFQMTSAAICGALPPSGAYSASVLVTGTGSTPQAATAARDAAHSRVLAFLTRRGFSASDVTSERPTDVEHDEQLHRYVADQEIDVRSKSFVDLSRTDNAVNAQLDPTGTIISMSLPTPTFYTLSLIIALGFVFCLTLAVASLETRSADVSRAPRASLHRVLRRNMLVFMMGRQGESRRRWEPSGFRESV
jgi:hypothetical protein